MKSEYDIIKRKYGEGFAKLCRSSFPMILEKPGKLLEILESKFTPSHYLYQDIIENNKEPEFKNLIVSLFYEENQTRQNHKSENIATPETLMNQAGYNLFKCETFEDILQFKKYYNHKDPLEVLCTFCDKNRINTHHVFFAVKKNVEKIKRENFTDPKRQDEYGTSVISLQFTKGPESILSIKNRYNHAVPDPDSTFSSDPENIIAGLTESFEKYYGLKLISGKKNFELPSYVLAEDKKYYRYNYEIDNVYYCADNVIIVNSRPEKFDKAKFELFDYFILDKQVKRIYFHPVCLLDSQLKDLKFEKVDVVLGKNKGEHIIKLTTFDNKKIIITLNNKNQIIKYYDEATQELQDGFMNHCKYIQKIEMPNLKTINNNVFELSENLETFIAPKLEFIGNASLKKVNKLEKFFAPNLINMQGQNLCYAKSLKFFDANKIQCIGPHSLSEVNVLEEINLPNLKEMAENCFVSAESLKNINLTSLTVLSNYCFTHAPNLITVNMPILEEIGDHSLREINKVQELDFPALKTIGKDCFVSAQDLKSFKANSLTEIGSNVLSRLGKLTSLSLPSLQVMQKNSLNSVPNLKYLNLPNLNKMGHNCVEFASSLEEVNLNSLKEIKEECFQFVSNLKTLNLPALEILEINCFRNAQSLKSFSAKNLKITRNKSLSEAINLTNINVPNLTTLGIKSFEQVNNLTHFNAKNLKVMQGFNFQEAQALKSFNAPNLIKIGSFCFGNTPNLKNLKLGNGCVLNKETERDNTKE